MPSDSSAFNVVRNVACVTRLLDRSGAEALAEAYAAAGAPLPAFTDPVLTPGVTMPTAAHILELRAAVIAIE